MERDSAAGANGVTPGKLARLRNRGLFRVAISYAVISWLCLQIGDVVLDPLDAPAWIMRAMIVLVVAGFPIALVLAWYFELGPGGVTVDQLPEAAARPSVRGARRYSDIIIIAVLMSVIVLLLARQGGLLEEHASTPVIGVLPFTEQGGPEDGYFGTGLADTLTYKLGQLRQILVLAPSSTREFGAPGQDLKAIGALLGATALLEGTVRRAMGSLKVNARLVDIASGQQLWSGSFERPAADLFALQDEIATSVTEALQLVLSPEETDRVTHTLTDDLSAYDAFLLGHARLATRDSARMDESVEYFRRAIRIDPGYALAQAGLAEALYLATAYAKNPRDWNNLENEARAAAAQAQALDPSGGEGYLAQAFAAMGDNDFGDGSAWPDDYIAALLKRAVELSPNNATALKFYAGYVANQEEGLALMQRAAQLDPRSSIIQMNLGDMLSRAGDIETGLEHYLAAIRLNGGHFRIAHLGVPFLLQFELGKTDVAARWARTLYRANPAYEPFIAYSRALLGLGAWQEVQQLLDQPSAEVALDAPVLLRQRIVLSLARGDCAGVDRAIAMLVKQLPDTATGISPDKIPEVVILEPARVAQALCEVRAGRMDMALQLLEAARGELAQVPFGNIAALALRSQVLLATLYKAKGKPELARQALDRFMVEAGIVPVMDSEGVSFARFLALAVQGETEAALAELQLVYELGWTGDWWLLDALDFDPEVATVLKDPRFKAINTQLEESVRQMRENFSSNPDLPEEQLQNQ